MKKLLLAVALLLPMFALAQPVGHETQRILNELTQQADRLERVVNRRVLRHEVTRAARRFNRVTHRLAMCGQRLGPTPRPIPRPRPGFGRGLPAHCRPVLQRARQAFREVNLYLGGAYEFPRLQRLLQRIRQNLRSLRAGGPGPIPHRQVQCFARPNTGWSTQDYVGQLSFSRAAAEQSALRACELAQRGPWNRGTCYITRCRTY